MSDRPSDPLPRPDDGDTTRNRRGPETRQSTVPAAWDRNPSPVVHDSDIAFLAGEGAVLWAALGDTVVDLSAELDPTVLYVALANILERMEAPMLTAALVYGVVATFGKVAS